MTGEQLDEKAIFNVARKIESPAARAEYLQQACGTDDSLRARVEVLLCAYEEQASFLELSPVNGESPTMAQPVTELVGDTIGPYKLLQRIAEGGMGVVYMAEQEQPVARQVALKVIKPGMDTRQVIARFEAERQALAMMDHPNIAKVFDAGTTHTGRPYFVMELVKGAPITQYCDEKQLTPRQRLELFVPVCQAVQHAHQKGIIHRDIKPSNVLVAHYDDRPVPKVIDFGVAKAIEQRLTEKTVFTEFGQVVGTPEYMSPEQAKLNQLDIDTRTDVYSLGVLLYELLTGETPFNRERLRSAAFDELLRIIREEDPPRPSAKLSTSDSLPSIAANRRVEPKYLSAQVHGELDWIVMKALEKDRTRRYGTASNFAEDVQHYLNDEPVEACPPSVGYRVRKFARRNKAFIATALALAALLILGLISTTWQAIRATRERNRAITAETRAHAETERADQGERMARVNLHSAQIDLAEHELVHGHKGRALKILSAARPATGQEDLRGFAWHHLWSRANDGLLKTVQGPLGDMRSVAFSPDGVLIASTNLNGIVRIWDRDSGREVRTLSGHTAPARCVAFSSDSKLIATGGPDANVIVWNTATGLEQFRFKQDSEVIAVAFAPGDRILASQAPDTKIRIWDLPNIKLRSILDAPEKGDRGGLQGPFIRFSPDGTFLAAGNDNDRLNIWDVATGRMTHQFAKWLGFTDVEISPDGRFIASICGERQVIIWAVETGERLLESQPLNAFPRCIAFSPDSNSIAVGFTDGTLMHHDIISGRSRLFAHHSAIRSVVFSADGVTLVSAGACGDINTWRIRPISGADQLSTVPPRDKVWAMEFSPDGSTLAFGAGRRVWFCNVATGEITADLTTNSNILGLAFSPDGRLLATCGGGDAELWDVQKRSLLGVLETVSNDMHLYAAAFSPNGQILAIAGRLGTINLYDVATQARIGTMQAPEFVWSLAFSSDGKMLASGGGGGERAIRLWDWQTRKELEVTPGYGPVHFSPDETCLAFQSVKNDGIGLWDTAKKQLHMVGESPASIFFAQSQFAFFPDGKTLAMVASGRVTLWDVATGRELPMFRKFPHWVFSVVVSPDGQTMATGGTEGGVQLWRTSRIDGGLACLPPLHLDPDSNPLQLFTPLQRLAWCCDSALHLIEAGKHDQADVCLQGAVDSLEQVADDENDRVTGVISCLELERALQRLDGNASALRTKFSKLVSDQYKLAIEMLDRNVAKEPKSPDSYANRARFYAKSKAWDEAAADCVKVIDLSEDTGPSASIRKLARDELAAVPELFQRVAELRPDSPVLWIGRGQYRALRSQWKEAVSDYARANPAKQISDETFEYAALLQLTGNEPGYQQLCTELATRDEDLKDGIAAYVVARTCSIGLARAVPPEQLVEWASRAAQENPDAWLLHALGLAYYRAGQFQQAIETLEKSNAARWSGLAKAQNDLVLAMTHYSAGRQAEARQWLEKATATIDAARPKDAGKPVNAHADDWIGLEVLRREAQSIIQPNDTAGSKEPTSEQKEIEQELKK